jgi:hypothetical protein
MTTRTSWRTITFKSPFLLAGLDEPLPAGEYRVETEEERIEGISYAAYRRSSTVLRLPAASGPAYLTRAMTVDPDELTAALERDLAGAESAR